jgi:hypothetical protein
MSKPLLPQFTPQCQWRLRRGTCLEAISHCATHSTVLLSPYTNTRHRTACPDPLPLYLSHFVPPRNPTPNSHTSPSDRPSGFSAHSAWGNRKLLPQSLSPSLFTLQHARQLSPVITPWLSLCLLQQLQLPTIHGNRPRHAPRLQQPPWSTTIGKAHLPPEIRISHTPPAIATAAPVSRSSLRDIVPRISQHTTSKAMTIT